MNAPLPTAAVASITVTRMLAVTNPPPGAKFVGIALNSTGQILLNTASPDNRLFRLENNLSVTFLTTMNRDMGDLTSCNFPLIVLPTVIKEFAAAENNGQVLLNWQLAESVHSGYSIQHSSDGKHWQELQVVHEKILYPGTYSYLHMQASSGNNFYRIKLFSSSGHLYSAVKSVALKGEAAFATWPNPVHDKLYISGNANKQTPVRAVLCDFMGNAIQNVEIHNGINAIDMKSVSAGCYILKIETTAGTRVVQKVIKK
jgi:hypothetical protein